MLQNRSYLPANNNASVSASGGTQASSSTDTAMDASSSTFTSPSAPGAATRKRGRAPSEEASGSKLMRGTGVGGEGADAWSNRRISGGPQTGQSRGAGAGSGQHHVPNGYCRDFHLRGFCARGDHCKYIHLPPGGIAALPFAMQQHGVQPSLEARIPGQNGKGTSGEDAEMSNGDKPPSSGGAGMMPPFGFPGMPMMPGMEAFMMANMAMPPGVGGRGGGHHHRGGSRGGGGGRFGSFNSTRKSATTLVLENVPAENLDLMQVNERFKRFGTITNIQIDQANQKALVSYATPDEAKRAHTDPDVIFGSRFVKVYFQRIDEGEEASSSSSSSAATHHQQQQGATSRGRPSYGNGARSPVVTNADVKMLATDAKAKQNAVNTMLEEQKALMGSLTSLDAEAKKKAMSRLRELAATIPSATQNAKEAAEKVKNVGPITPIPESSRAMMERAKRKQLDRELELLQQANGNDAMDTSDGAAAAGSGGEAKYEPSTPQTTEELKAKLAALKAEAAALGIEGTAAGATRGRGRGRGRPFARGRGGFARGSANLDNRPKELFVDTSTEAGETIEGEKRSKLEGWLKVSTIPSLCKYPDPAY